MTDQEAYNELAYYTLTHQSPEFIHQYIVDVYAAQHADATSKPIYLAFALAGLYLHNEKKYSVKDVLAVPPGIERDEAIQKWSASVWATYDNSHAEVAAWLNRELR